MYGAGVALASSLAGGRTTLLIYGQRNIFDLFTSVHMEFNQEEIILGYTTAQKAAYTTETVAGHAFAPFCASGRVHFNNYYVCSVINSDCRSLAIACFRNGLEPCH